LNPYASVADVIRLLEQTAHRAGGWTPDLGWGILDAGAALDAARRLDRLAPVSMLRAPATSRRRRFVVAWTGHDQQRPGLIASGIDHYELYVSVSGARPRLLALTHRHSLTFTARPGVTYTFFTVAVDRAGNREPHPVRRSTRVARAAR
jgi:hypothetical protein